MLKYSSIYRAIYSYYIFLCILYQAKQISEETHNPHTYSATFGQISSTVLCLFVVSTI